MRAIVRWPLGLWCSSGALEIAQQFDVAAQRHGRLSIC